MLGTIFDIKRYTLHDGPGIRTTVFFKGCPLKCWWCHNPESQSKEIETVEVTKMLDGKPFICNEIIGKEISTKDLLKEIEKDVSFYDESHGGVTFSGGEPLMQFEFLKEMLTLCKSHGIHTALDTSGFGSKNQFEELIPLVDIFLFDIKLLENEKHKEFTGASNKKILENLELIAAKSSTINFRIPVIPNITDSIENIERLKKFLDNMPRNKCTVNLLPYHTIANHKYMRLNFENKMADTPSLNKSELEYLKCEIEMLGYKVKIGG